MIGRALVRGVLWCSGWCAMRWVVTMDGALDGGWWTVDSARGSVRRVLDGGGWTVWWRLGGAGGVGVAGAWVFGSG